MRNDMLTYKAIGEELDKAIEGNPKLKQCINCVRFNRATSQCEKTKMTMMPYVPGCAGKWFITAREYLIEKALAELKSQARECEKIEFLLAMSLTAANMTTLFIEDLERRVKVVRNREEEKTDSNRGKLKKDLDMADQMRRAFKNISDYLTKIEAQYRFYIQPHLDKIFMKEGVYNVEGHDQFHADAGEFATFLLELARVAHHNRDNADEIYNRMRQMKNYNPGEDDNTFCLDDKDIEHYRLKG